MSARIFTSVVDENIELPLCLLDGLLGGRDGLDVGDVEHDALDVGDALLLERRAVEDSVSNDDERHFHVQRLLGLVLRAGREVHSVALVLRSDLLHNLVADTGVRASDEEDARHC